MFTLRSYSGQRLNRRRIGVASYSKKGHGQRMRVERERPKVRAYEKNGGMNMSCDSRSRLTWPYKGHSIHDQPSPAVSRSSR